MAHGISHLGVAPATVLTRARTALHDRKAQGLHAGMRLTYLDPDRSTDPGWAVPGARSVIVAARPYLADDEPSAPTATSARVARYAWADHYEPLRTTLRDMARRLRRAGERAVAFADDNSIVDREVAHLGGIGWFGKNANLLVPGAGSFFVLGCIVTTAPAPDALGAQADALAGFDSVIVATGVAPRDPDIPGQNAPHVLRYTDVLRGAASVGARVVIVGAGGIGGTLNTALSRYEYDSAGAILMIIIAIVMVAEYSSSHLRRLVK